MCYVCISTLFIFLSLHSGLDICCFSYYGIVRIKPYGVDDREFESRQGLGIFLFSTASTEAHPTSYSMGARALSLEVKRPGREADHSPPSSVEVKEYA
jgi:hypothetical protein